MQRHESIAAAAKSLDPPVSPNNLRYYVRKSKEFMGFQWSYADLNEGGHRDGPPARSRSTKRSSGQGRHQQRLDRSKASARASPAKRSKVQRDGGSSFVTPKDQGWGLLLDAGIVQAGDVILPPGKGAQKRRRAIVQSDGELLEGPSTRWRDPVAFAVEDNEWRESESFLKHRNKFSNCAHLRAGDGDDGGQKLSDLKHAARNRRRSSSGGIEESFSRTSRHRPGASGKVLHPAIGARVLVRCEIKDDDDDDETVDWFDAKITGFNKRTGEWDIKLDYCDNAPDCTGCGECKYQLASDTSTW